MKLEDVPCLVDHETRSEVIDYIAEKATDDMILCELGTFMGGSMCRLLTKLKELGKSPKVYAIDNWQYENISTASLAQGKINSPQEGYEKFLSYLSALDLKCNIIREDTRTAAQHFEDKSVSYLFCDANHGYQGVYDELKAWLPKMKDKCLIAIHDWPSKGIQNAVHDVFGQEVGTTSNGATGILINSI